MLSRAFRRGLCHSLPIRAASNPGAGQLPAKKDEYHDTHHDDHHHDDHHHEHVEQPDVYSEVPVDKASMNFWNYRPDFAHVAPWVVTHEMDTNTRVKRGYFELITPHYHMGRLYSKDALHAVAPTLTENIIHGMLPWSYARLFFWLVAVPVISTWILDNEFPGFFVTRMVRWWLGLGEYNWAKYHEMAVNEGFIQEDDEPDYFGVFDWYYKAQWKKAREGK